LLLAILTYVTLDLSLPTMPGAFVFEPSDSVESAQMSRVRRAAEVAVLPAIARDPFIVSQPPPSSSERLAPTAIVASPEHRAHSFPRRLAPDPASPSEDPH
jgi:hypothetical protein